MKKRIILAIFALMMILSIVSSPFIAEAVETNTLTEAKDKLLEMESSENFDVEEYKETVEIINDIVAEKNIEDVPMNVTFEKAQDLEALKIIDEQHEIEIKQLEIRLLDSDGEKNTLFIQNDNLDESLLYAVEVAQESGMDLIGVVSVNVKADSEEVKKLNEEDSVFLADASTVDYVEDKVKVSEKSKKNYPESVAWELGI